MSKKVYLLKSLFRACIPVPIVYSKNLDLQIPLRGASL